MSRLPSSDRLFSCARSTRTILVDMTHIATITLAVCLAMPASAQTRQDPGGYGRYNTPTGQTFLRELELRNALVTGNAPGGFSFRGSAGYTAPREFRGELASDELFAFRRDSIASGISGLGIRGTESLQHQFGLTVGASFNPDLARSFTFSRSANFQAIRGGSRTFDPSQSTLNTGLTRPTSIDSAISTPRPATTALPSTPDTAPGLWTLRSTSGYTATRPLTGQLLHRFQTQDGRFATTTASPLMGIETLTDEPHTPSPETNAPLRLDSRIDTVNHVFSPAIETYQDALEREPEDRSMDPIRAFLNANDPSQQPAQPDEDTPDLGFGTPEPDAPVTSDDAPLLEDEREDARDVLIRRLRDMGVSEETLEVMRRQRLEVDSLVPRNPDLLPELYTLHMQAAERLMAQARYFEAEARYTLALAENPGDTAALAARVHAAIGAGLYVSAAANLRLMLSERPELITVRYDHAILPRPGRLADAVEELTELSQPDRRTAREGLPLLLAYIGYQTDDEPALRTGLARMSEPGDQRLALLLQLIWIDEKPTEKALEAVGEDDDTP